MSPLLALARQVIKLEMLKIDLKCFYQLISGQNPLAVISQDPKNDLVGLDQNLLPS